MGSLGIVKLIVNRLFFLVVVIWLYTRSKPHLVWLNEETHFNGVVFSSEMTILPIKLCCIWTSTRDSALRKSSYPSNHRYGLAFDIRNKSLYLILCILLCGDIATNPGPVQRTGPGLVAISPQSSTISIIQCAKSPEYKQTRRWNICEQS